MNDDANDPKKALDATNPETGVPAEALKPAPEPTKPPAEPARPAIKPAKPAAKPAKAAARPAVRKVVGRPQLTRPLLTTKEAAPLLGLTHGALLRRLQRATRRTPDGSIEARIMPGVVAMKLGAHWRIDIAWITWN